jgi:branched-subunit amino acid ABC-type transport system permease component
MIARYLKFGKAMRAVSNDVELADISGIPPKRIIMVSFLIGSILGGLVGIFMSLETYLTPAMGMNALLMGIITVIVGGINRIFGIALASLLLAFAQHFGSWYIGSEWKDAIAFLILVVFLLFKPEGLLGKKLQETSI